MPHPDEGLIHAWLDGELDAAEAARVEALVASDADWAAAAADARGLIAASARIVGALDRVPADVIPKAAAAPPASRRWVWRAAAILALMAGSAVVLEREPPALPAPKADVAAPAAPAPVPPMPAAPTPKAKAFVAKKNREGNKELADTKPAEPARDAVNAPMAAAARAEAQPAAPAPAAAPAAAPAVQNFALQKLTRLQPSCFAQREPADSAVRIIRLGAAALADSLRLETLVLRGDTLVAANGRFTAVRVPCPEP